MSETNERSVGSTGSVAWGVVNAKGEVESIQWKWQDAVGMALIDGEAVPLYRSPKLTDEERDAVKWGIACMQNSGWNADGLRGLLERIG